jgi:hypothetical protein
MLGAGGKKNLNNISKGVLWRRWPHAHIILLPLGKVVRFIVNDEEAVRLS